MIGAQNIKKFTRNNKYLLIIMLIHGVFQLDAQFFVDIKLNLHFLIINQKSIKKTNYMYYDNITLSYYAFVPSKFSFEFYIVKLIK